MRRTLAVTQVIVALLLVEPIAVSACGDKFLVATPGGGACPVQQAIHPSSILLFANPESKVAQEFLTPELAFMLELAGHRTKTVKSFEDLQPALASGAYDLVLMDLADVDRMSLHGEMVLLPVTLSEEPSASINGTAMESVLVLTGDLRHMLETIDRAIETAGKST